MKKAGSFLAGLLISTPALHAQQITGNVKDTRGKGIDKATIFLLNEKDSSVAKLAVSGASGMYSFSTADGRYFISASHIGFATVYSPSFEVAGGGNITVPDIIVKEKAAV